MFSARAMPPDATHAPLKKLNTLVKGAMCDILEIETLPQHVQDIASLSLANGGLGITNLHAIRHTAYFASVAHAIKTWTQHFGADHPVISKWTDSNSRSCTQLKESFEVQRKMVAVYNTTTILPTPLTGPDDEGDKADPEQHIKRPPLPSLPQSINTISTLLPSAVSRMQNNLSKVANIIAFRGVWLATSKNDGKRRTQILANTVASTNLWLRALPTTARFRFTSFEFRLNILQHFALDDEINVLLHLPTGRDAIPCACGRKDSHTNKPVPATYQHLLNCTHAGAFTTRHNNLVNVCAESIRSVGLSAELECAVSKNSTTTDNINQSKSKKRFDVSVAGIANANIAHADVTVASHRQRDPQVSKQCARFALTAANNAVKTKKTTYDSSLLENETLYPLAAETSGAIHNNYNQFFSLLASRVDNKPPPEANWTTPTFSSFWMTVASTVLRKENARALQKLAREARRLAGEVEEDLPALVPGGRRQ
jgi:hypothetical protein